ncbi:MAG: hypothetical protein U1E76_06340 [Planctomycetota bacterium]
MNHARAEYLAEPGAEHSMGDGQTAIATGTNVVENRGSRARFR